VFRASKTAALTVVRTAALTVSLSAQPAPALGWPPTAAAMRALTLARRIEEPMGAPILVRI